MKIYASRQNDVIDKLVGKELWVKVKSKLTPYINNYYLRILDIDENDIVTYNRFLPLNVNLNLSYINFTYTIEKFKFYPADPLVILTTDEVLEMYNRAGSEE